jgi:hypothetical protein
MPNIANGGGSRRWIAVAAATTLVTLACLPAAARASETVNGSIKFVPYTLGAGTTIESNVRVVTPDGELPSPLVKIELHFPQTLSFTSSTLGLATCFPENLIALGPTGCPANSRIGTGTSRVAVPFGPDVVSEKAEVVTYMGPPVHEGVTLIIFGEGHTPLSAYMLMQGSLVGGNGPVNKLLLKSDVPLIPTLPGARDVAMTSMQLDFGPRFLTYYEHVNGHTVSFHPRGLILPTVCPTGGFPFTSTMTFQDGTVTSLNLDVPCQAHGRRAKASNPRRRA